MKFEVLVVGGGHAGIEAAHASARMGRRTALLTGSLDAIGRMSCNPAIGGLAKGQLVREIDALGGLMGGLADAAGIQFRILNRSRGPAVWGPRAQCDRALYARLARGRLEATENLTLLEGMAEELTSESGRVTGALTADGRRIAAGAVVVTTGTFLNGLMHTGARKTAGGRVGEAAAAGLSGSLARLGLALGRFKTGTPPRVHRDSIDYDACRPQPGDDPPVPFSFRTRTLPERQALCWLTATNPRVHALIREHLHESPMYSGQIHGTGPRYCPSVEDKVVKFADKSGHTIFLEPDGVRFRGDLHQRALDLAARRRAARDPRGDPGPHARADDPARLRRRVRLRVSAAALERRSRLSRCRGSFSADRSTARRATRRRRRRDFSPGSTPRSRRAKSAPFVLERSEAYAAVMVDDLTQKGVEEPYRLFTSRAEYRLLLGVDTVLPRLLPHGRRLGLIDRAEFDDAMRGEDRLRRGEEALRRAGLQPQRREPRAASRETRNRDRSPRQRI